MAAAGFAILWPSTAPAQALVGLVLGIGLGNLFPTAMSVTVRLALGLAALATGRAVAMTSFAVLLAPLAVGTLADATSLKTALGVVPVALFLAAVGLIVSPASGPSTSPSRHNSRRPVVVSEPAHMLPEHLDRNSPLSRSGAVAAFTVAADE